MPKNEFKSSIIKILDEIDENSKTDSARALGIAKFCEVILDEKFKAQRLAFAEILFERLCTKRDASPSPEIPQSEERLIIGILKLFNVLSGEELDKILKEMATDDKYLAEIYLLSEWGDNVSVEKRLLLSYHLIEAEKRIIKSRRDIYSKKYYRYQNGLFIIRGGNHLAELYGYMGNKGCLLLLILDLVKPFIPLNGYGYMIDEADYNTLERAGLLERVGECHDCALKSFIQATVRAHGETGNMRFIKAEPEDYSRLIEDFWRTL